MQRAELLNLKISDAEGNAVYEYMLEDLRAVKDKKKEEELYYMDWTYEINTYGTWDNPHVAIGGDMALSMGTTMLILDLRTAEWRRETAQSFYDERNNWNERVWEYRRKEKGILDNGKFLLNNLDGAYLKKYSSGEYISHDFDFYMYDTIELIIPASELPQNNPLLYAKFPGLKDYQGKTEYKVYFLFTDWPKVEEVVSLFLEEGEEISFEGVIMSANESVDEQEHNIESFADWERWRQQ